MMTDKTMTRISWALSALFALFMLGASALPKLAGMAIAPETMAALGWADAPILLIGGLELGLTLLFLFPPTAVLGGILMMGLLGGAMVTQLRAGSPQGRGSVSFGLLIGWRGILREHRSRASPRREDQCVELSSHTELSSEARRSSRSLIT